MEKEVLLALEVIQQEEEEEDLRLKAKEEAHIAGEARIKAEEEERARLMKNEA